MSFYFGADRNPVGRAIDTPVHTTSQYSQTNLVWRNETTGENLLWTDFYSVFYTPSSLPTVQAVNWQVQASADFNRDGQSDLVWRDTATGQNQLWYLNQAGVVGVANLPTVADGNFQVVAADDFNHDGRMDLLWRNSSSGQVMVWHLNGTQVISTATLPNPPSTTWQIQGVADFDGDDRPDLLWRNTLSGENVLWYLNQTQVVGTATLPTLNGGQWQIQGTADFSGDDRPDLFWRNTITGENVIWQMAGIQVIGINYPGNIPGTWHMTPLRAHTLFENDPTGNTPTTARSLGTLKNHTVHVDGVGGGDPVDYYQFTLAQASHLNLAVTGLSSDANLRLFRDGNGNGLLETNELVHRLTRNGSADEVLNVANLATGSYYLEVYRPIGYTSYTLHLSTSSLSELLPAEIDWGTLTSDRTATGTINGSNRVDTYRFTLATTQQASLSLTGLSADADVRLIQDLNSNGVVDAGDELARSQQDGTANEAIARELASGTYFIQVYQYAGTTNYTLTLNTTPIVDPGNTLTTARNLGILTTTQTVNEFVGTTDTNDYYRFSLNTLGTVSISLTGLAADADLQLIQDANSNGQVDSGEVLAGSYLGGSLSETIIRDLAVGTYFVRVYPYSGSTNYSLTLSTQQDAGNTLSTARNLGLLTTVQSFNDSVSNTDINDYYRFSLSSTSSVTLNLTGMTADADMQLIRDANNNGIIDYGEVIAYPYQDGSAPETLTIALGAGTYFVRIFRYSGNTNYTFSASAQFINAPANYDFNYGYGLVNAAAAVAQALGQNPFPAVPDLGNIDWGLDMVNAPEVWAQGYTGQNVVVAVVDSGVDYSHPDLAANIWVNSAEIPGNGIDDDQNGYIDDVHGWDFIDNDNTPEDFDSHGTHVAGTIAAQRNGVGTTGVAYNARIMPVRVLNDFGTGSNQGVAAGIRYAAANGADVINLSLGGGFSSLIADAVAYAVQQGTVVVMAAGNEYANQPGFPASLANQYGIAVGAVDIDRRMAGFSNRAGLNPLSYVVAPGVSIYSTVPDNGYSSYSGTSMATPHVAGVAALILSANPNLTPTQVVNLLNQTATRTGITA
jgi:subtilisin family serine protease